MTNPAALDPAADPAANRQPAGRRAWDSGAWMGRLRSALRPGAWGVADQGFSALASLVINLALIRWLGADEYGAYAVAFSWHLLLGGVHNALVVEPLLVFGAGTYRDCAIDYLNRLMIGHWVVALTLSLTLLAVGFGAWALGSAELFVAFAGVGIAVPGLLLLVLARRIHYLLGTPRPAALGGALYLVAAAVGVAVLHLTGLLSSFTAFALMGGLGLLVGTGLLVRRGVRVWRPVGRGWLSVRAIAREHWLYGRWVIATSLADWIPLNLYYIVLPATLGLEAAGILAGLMLFLRPVMTVAQPLALLMLPRLVRQGQSPEAARDVSAAIAAFLAGALLYWGLLAFGHGLFTGPILGAEYRPHSHLLIVLGGFAPMLAVAVVLACGLRARVRPDLEFRAHLFAAIVTVAVGLPLALTHGLVGAAIGLPVSMAALAAAMAFLFYARVATPQADPRRSGS